MKRMAVHIRLCLNGLQQVPWWAVATVFALAGLLGAVASAAYLGQLVFGQNGLEVRPTWVHRLLFYVSIAAIPLGVLGALAQAEQRRAGLIAALLGATALLAWAVVRSLGRLLLPGGPGSIGVLWW